MKKSNGFSLLELVLAMAVISGMIYIFIYFSNEIAVQQQAKNLATDTSVYAKAYTRYIKDLEAGSLYVMTKDSNCKLITTPSAGATAIITTADLMQNFGTPTQSLNPLSQTCTPNKDNYLPSNLTKTNALAYIPCASVTKNQFGNLEGFVFWGATTKSKNISSQLGNLARISLGGAGGFFDESGNFKSGGGWSIAANDSRLDFSACGATSLASNAPILNLNQFTEFNSALSNSLAINRHNDTNHRIGDLQNSNIAKTDIYLKNKNIVFSTSSGLSITPSSDGLKVNNGNLKAKSLQSLKTAASGDQCSADQIGSIISQQETDGASHNIAQGNLVCTHSPVVCGAYGYDDCYLPIKGQSLRFTNLWQSQFICPSYSPTLFSIKITIPYLITKGSVMCDSWWGQNKDCNDNLAIPNNPTYLYNITANVQILQPTTPSYIYSYDNQSYVQRGVNLPQGSYPSCSDICGVDSGTLISQFRDTHTGRTGVCYCHNNSGYYGAFYQFQELPPTPFIQEAICSQKIIIN